MQIRWDILLGGLIFYSVIVIPLRVGFSIENNPDIELSDVIIDSIFGLDIIISFDTAIIGDEDELITNRSLIAKDYLTHWFVIDFLSTVPIDKIVAAFTKGGSGSGSDVKLIRILRLARLMKLARVFKVSNFRGAHPLALFVCMRALYCSVLYCTKSSTDTPPTLDSSGSSSKMSTWTLSIRPLSASALCSSKSCSRDTCCRASGTL